MCHILFSCSRSGAHATRSGTHRDTPRAGDPGLRAPDTRLGTWGLRVPRELLRFPSLRLPPPELPPEPGATRAPVSSVESPAGSPPRGQSCLEPGGSHWGADWRGLRADSGLQSAPRCEPYCSQQRAAGESGERKGGPVPRG